MISAETSLLIAVRNQLRTAMDLTGTQCDVELDDQVPAVAGDLYIAVVPGGARQGQRHNSSGGTIDIVMGCRVTVFQRMTDVPRDRRRSVFLERTRGINKKLSAVMAAIDFKYDVLTAANVLEVADGGSAGFKEPLKFVTIDDKPQPVLRDPYDAAGGKGGDPILAIKRGMNFFGARFLKTR